MDSNVLSAFKEFFFKEMRPLFETRTNDDCYASQLKSFKVTKPIFNLRFQLSYEHAFNNKTRYVSQLLLDNKYRVLNELEIDRREGKVKGSERKAMYENIDHELGLLISFVNEFMKTHLGGWGDLESEDLFNIRDMHVRTGAFMLHYLKRTIEHLQAEFRCRFYTSSNPQLRVGGHHETFDVNPGQAETMLNAQASPEAYTTGEPIPLNASVAVVGNAVAQVFVPKRFDTHVQAHYPNIQKMPGYFELVENQDKLAGAEKLFFDHGLINHEYYFCGRRGDKNLMAVIFHLLIGNGYFKTFINRLGRDTKERDFLNFLNHRYGVLLDKQFSNFSNSPADRKELISQNLWLGQL